LDGKHLSGCFQENVAIITCFETVDKIGASKILWMLLGKTKPITNISHEQGKWRSCRPTARLKLIPERFACTSRQNRQHVFATPSADHDLGLGRQQRGKSKKLLDGSG
jgi:hypothetical protein